MILFAVNIFLSSFLLFQIQPMIGRFILPRFGGSPSVWSTLMLVFQVLLTGGYAYAAWLISRVQKAGPGAYSAFDRGDICACHAWIFRFFPAHADHVSDFTEPLFTGPRDHWTASLFCCPPVFRPGGE